MTKRNHREFDWPLVGIVLALATVGLANLYSASVVAERAYHITQLGRMLAGLGVAALLAWQDYRLAARGAYIVWGVVSLLLVAVLAVGTTFNNSTRWLDLGFFMLQPSEILKITVVLVAARYFSDHARPAGYGLADLVAPTALCAVPVVLVVLQPDLGTGLVIVFIYGAVCVFAGIRWSALVGIAASAVAAAPLMWAFGMRDYQRQRVLTFLNPTENLQGDAWQVTQSKIAIGSGQWFGKGFLEGTQVHNGFVPEHENDFIFAHHGEQFGFVGSVALLLAYFALLLWCLRIARYGRDRFAVLCAVGIAAFFFFHVVVNLGMVTGMLPVVGLWLPLASYGGSSTLTVFVALGLLMSISMRRATF